MAEIRCPCDGFNITLLKTKVYKGSSMGQIETGGTTYRNLKIKLLSIRLLWPRGTSILHSIGPSNKGINRLILPFFSQDSQASCIRRSQRRVGDQVLSTAEL
jgi:hypothetical protein